MTGAGTYDLGMSGIAAWEYGRRRAELDAGHADPPLTFDGLTAEQEIRARALHEAMAFLAGVGLDTDGDVDSDCDLILDIADRFAAYLATGVHPPEPEHRLVAPAIGYLVEGRMYRPDDATVVREPSTVEAP